MESKDSMNSISKYSKSGQDDKLRVRVTGSQAPYRCNIYLNGREAPYLPWSMSAKLVRYRIRDDSFNTSGMWSVAGIYYPVPRLNWWYRESAGRAWNLVKTVNYAVTGPVDLTNNKSTELVLRDVPSSGWELVAAFSDSAPPIKASSGKPTHFDLFSTDVFIK